jgi:hypothetical protein
MDQGFAAQELASSNVARTVARTAPRPAPAGKPHEATLNPAGAMAVAHSVASSERNVQGFFSKAQGILSMAFLLQLVGLGVSKLPQSWTKIKFGLGSVFGGIPSALESTTFSTATQLPANFFKGIAARAQEANFGAIATKTSGWAGVLETQGSKLGGLFTRLGESAFIQKLPATIKNFGTRAGGMNLFIGSFIVSSIAGIGAALFGARATSKEATAAFQMVQADLGGKSGAFAQAMAQYYASAKKKNIAKAGFETVGGAVNSVVMTHHNLGMGVIGASMLPDLCAMIMPESPLLGGYQALTHHDQGKAQLAAVDRVKIVTGLVGIMPDVAMHGGEHNRLAMPIAKAMIDRGLNTAQMAQLMNDSSAFSALTAEVSAKMKAAQPASAKAGHAGAHAPAANDAQMHPHAVAANQPHINGISAVHHQGRLAAEPHKERA